MVKASSEVDSHDPSAEKFSPVSFMFSNKLRVHRPRSSPPPPPKPNTPPHFSPPPPRQSPPPPLPPKSP
ncbi:hypothetical protein TIFTF001_001035 [Ficus carica]|uniref:Uncharacterized protein n=1 Tax=Ficus carica TaxID=3494 RepID=A0AA88CPA1_FICCA|nr:hypothetical protein TIFTF001_001035 [Ficus carica]